MSDPWNDLATLEAPAYIARLKRAFPTEPTDHELAFVREATAVWLLSLGETPEKPRPVTDADRRRLATVRAAAKTVSDALSGLGPSARAVLASRFAAVYPLGQESLERFVRSALVLEELTKPRRGRPRDLPLRRLLGHLAAALMGNVKRTRRARPSRRALCQLALAAVSVAPPARRPSDDAIQKLVKRFESGV
jgi:hypothetical protein